MEIDEILLKFDKKYGRIDQELSDDVAALAWALYELLEYLKERLEIDSKK